MEGSNGANKRDLTKYLVASQLTHGRRGVCCRRECATGFWSRGHGRPFGTIWLYISTYTGKPGVGGNGQGIYLYELNLFTGNLTFVKLVARFRRRTTLSTASPSTIALDPNRTHLYAGNEYGPPGAVSAYSINRLQAI